MSNNPIEDFNVFRVIELARYKKYEITVAGFNVLDKIDRIDVPKKLKTRKVAVQALYALSENLVKYDYISLEEKKKLLQEINYQQSPRGKFRNIFSQDAPAIEESNEEENIPEEEPPVNTETRDSGDDEFGGGYEDDDYEEEDEDDDEDDFEDEEEEEEDFEDED